MEAVDRLRRDHEILRSKLDVMEYALGTGPEAWYVLREVCFTLSKQLHDHIKREEALVADCRRAMNPQVLAEVVVEHRDEPEHLRTVNRIFRSDTHCSLKRVAPALTDVIQGLRRHMDAEERELFPILERTLRDDASVEPSPFQMPHCNEVMTVNCVVREFPTTKPVFDRLFINLQMEGCTCLDEVAWRHGMEARELLEQLEQAIASCQCTARDPLEHREIVGTT